MSATQQLADQSLDWVYLDGDTRFQAVSADLLRWWPKVKQGGLMAGYGYLDAYLPGAGIFGVRWAVDRFAAQIGRAVTWSQLDGTFRCWYFRKQKGPSPTPERITVLSAYDDGFAACGDIARENHCKRNGYHYVCRREGFDRARAPSWSKLAFIARALDAADLVFWIDADAVFMNWSIRLESLIDDTAEVIVCRTGAFVPELNAGTLLVRSSPWSWGFLKQLESQTEFLTHPWWETAALIHLHDLPNGPRYLPDRVPNRIGDGHARKHIWPVAINLQHAIDSNDLVIV